MLDSHKIWHEKGFFTIFLVVLVLSNPVRCSAQVLSLDFCPTCVTFMGEALDELINIVTNIGVIVSCSDLCSYLEDSIEETICEALCDGVGLTVFVNLIKDMEKYPDPIYMCTALDVCSYNQHARGTVQSLMVMPPSAPLGHSFEFVGVYEVTNATGVGQINFSIKSPSQSQVVLSSVLVDDLNIGTYLANTTLTTSDFALYVTGTYVVTFEFCEGTCGSIWPNIVFGQQSQSFIILDAI